MLNASFTLYIRSHKTLCGLPGVLVYILLRSSSMEGLLVLLGAVPALEESVIWDAHGNSNVKHMACYYLQQLHNRDVVSKFDHLCVRAGFRCIVRAEGYRLHPEETTTIVEGAFVQLHAIPQVSAPPIDFADYFWHGDHFLEAGGNLLGHWVSPQITWSFHVLSEEGYLGHRDYSPSRIRASIHRTCGNCHVPLMEFANPPVHLLSLALSILVTDQLFISWAFQLTVIKCPDWFGVMLALWPLWSQPFGYLRYPRLRTSVWLLNLVIVFLSPPQLQFKRMACSTSLMTGSNLALAGSTS